VRTPPRHGEPRHPLSPIPSSDQVSLAVHDLGGDGRPILFAHATGFHGWVWQPLARHLDGYHAIAPDLRGHGDSTPPVGRSMEWAGFADDVLAVIDAWDLRDLLAVGHSKGGAALLLAEQRRPGTFAALYCYEPVVMPVDGEATPPSGPENPMAQGALRRRPVFASRQQAFENFSAKPPLSVLDPEALHAYVDHGFADQPDGTVRIKCLPEIEAATYQMGGTHGAFDHLGEVSCPVTVARGEVSTFGPATFASSIVDALPRGRLLTFDDLGHFGPLEAPARIAASVAETFAGS
jgi:pimeloyl-ACP methyl ester carboxylesterase